MPVSAIPWNNLTHVIHFAAAPGVNSSRVGDGSLDLTNANPADMANLIASRPAGKKVLLCIKDNDSYQSAFGQATAPSTVGIFVTNIVSLVTAQGYDGVSLDWESNVNVPQYENLISMLRSALPSMIIEVSVGNFSNLASLAGASYPNVDQVNVGCYDMDSGTCNGKACSWYNDALFQNGQTDKSTCDWRVAPFLSAGVPQSKIGIGIPFYGRRQTGVTQAQALGTFPKATFFYNALVTDPTRWQPAYQYYDNVFQANYLSIPSLDEWDNYVGVQEIQAAVAWQQTQGFGGFMFYALNYEYLAGQTGNAQYPLSTALNTALPTVNVSVATNPPGLTIVVDGASAASPQNFKWTSGSTHTIGVASPQGSGGTQYVFSSWSDSGAQTHTVTAPASPATYTASLSAQYLLTANASSPAQGAVTASPPSASGYYSSGATVQVTATPNPGYMFANWSGGLTGTANPQTLTMSAPASVTANFSPAPVFTVTTSPPSLPVVVDGVAGLVAPQIFYWTPGSSHSIGVTSPQANGSTRYVFLDWTDGGAQTHNVTAPAANTTYVADFTTQYLLTAGSSNVAQGTVTASPSSVDGFYISGAAVQLTASPSAGYLFANWSGDLSGTANPQTLTMNSPHSVTASFSSAPVFTVTTNPPGLPLAVDGASVTAPQTFNWTPGSTHSISVTSPQTSQANGGTRYAFLNWTDGGAQTHNVTAPAASTTYTANFTTQYLLTTSVSPAAGGTLAASPPSPDGFYASGTSVQLTANVNSGYQFAGWSGDLSGTFGTQAVTMTAPHNVTASFTVAPTGVTIATNPLGLAIVVDGASLTAPQTFNWTAGATHSIGVASPQGGGTRYVFGSWSDAGAQTHTITVPASSATYTASFTTQYLLSAFAANSVQGSVTASPPSPDGYYNSGAAVQLTAAPNAGYQLANWSGDLTGTANPQTLTMSAPHNVTANFSAVAVFTVATNPPGLPVVVDGSSVIAPQNFNWAPGSSHSIGVTSPQMNGGTRYVFLNWTDGGAQTHNVTTPATSATYTAAFTTQYLLTVGTFSTAGGTVAASPASPDGFYLSGTSVQLTASANFGYVFTNWSGDITGTAASQSLTMSAPHSVTANFTSAPNPIYDNTFFVNQLYLDLLGRPADSAGLNYWLPQLNSGQITRAQLAYAIFVSPEFENDGLFIISAYLAVLGRNPDYNGWLYNLQNLWAGVSPESVISSFIQSPEFQQTYGTLDNTGFVNLVYQNVLGRAADPTGLSYWVGQLSSGAATRADLMYSFTSSSEFQASIQNQALSILLYLGFLRRSPDLSGVTYWTGQLNAGIPPETVLNAFITSPEYIARF